MPQFLIDPSAVKNGAAVITGADARHITTVLRLKKGDWIVLTDGCGRRWRAEITSSSTKEVVVRLLHLLRTPNNEQRTTVVLAQALIKHDRFEWIIQKAVELGCGKIIPFTSERTVPCKVEGKLLRWQKIADEAAKQCGTSLRPVIEQPLNYLELLERFKQLEQVLLFYEGETKHNLNTQTCLPAGTALKHSNTILIIGPEGGFSMSEVEAAREAGVVTCGLGPLILRVETAAIAALTLVQYKLGYFDHAPLN